MRTQAIKANSIEVSTWKLVAKLGLLAALCMGLCYLFAMGVTTIAQSF
ncbi:MAG: hypothetical protein KIT80_00025 [Chitinophagaceae bacterium]|nr:hypothetical protein [Chitinophagaceae bacterium]MCW5925276.1 hypothetical protein [Chitinophagaceae bacterium]